MRRPATTGQLALIIELSGDDINMRRSITRAVTSDDGSLQTADVVINTAVK